MEFEFEIGEDAWYVVSDINDPEVGTFVACGMDVNLWAAIGKCLDDIPYARNLQIRLNEFCKAIQEKNDRKGE